MDLVLPDLLALGRVHEATGLGRRVFACGLVAELGGAVLWVQQGKQAEMIYPPGATRFFDPARLVMVRPTEHLPVLQVMEEALRSGAAPLVVGELDEAPDLTASRRLQLAAGTGGGRGLCLVPEGKLCSNAAETRWRCAPMPGGGAARQNWEIVKNKKGRLGQWDVAWDGDRFGVVERALEMA